MVQYASNKKSDVKYDGIIVSLSRNGNPYDNTIFESSIETSKYEKVLLNDFEFLVETYDYIAYCVNEAYNKMQLHSALGYGSPPEFEIASKEGRLDNNLKVVNKTQS